MTDLTEVTLETVAGRMAPKVFDHLFQKVLENIRDPNTDPEEVRSITLTVKFKPHKSRNEAACRLESKLKLASLETFAGHVFMRHQKDGSRATTHDTAQEDLPFDEGAGEAQDEKDVVDARTGEVLDIRSRRETAN